MNTVLLKAAAIRALRTFLQGVLSGGVITAAVAVANDGADPKVVVTALVVAAGAAVTSLIQSLIGGLPEAVETVTYDYDHIEYLPEGNFVTDSAGTWNADDIGDPTPAGE